jgi:hypothetical protein
VIRFFSSNVSSLSIYRNRDTCSFKGTANDWQHL